DTGTGQSIELRRNAAMEDASAAINPIVNPRTGQATSAANAASAMAQQLSQQAQPLTPPPANQPPNQPAAQQPGANQPGAQQPGTQPAAPAAVPGGPPVSFTVVPPTSNQAVGSTFQVAVMLGNGRDIFSVPLQM